MSFDKTLTSPVPPSKDVKVRFGGPKRGKMPQDGLSASAAEGVVPSMPHDSPAPKLGGDPQRPEVKFGGDRELPRPVVSDKFVADDPTR